MFSEFSSLFDSELLASHQIFWVWFSDHRICTFCNTTPLNWGIVKNVFLKEVVGFVWQHTKQFSLESPNCCTASENMQTCPLIYHDDPQEQNDGCKARTNQKFQDKFWTCREICKSCSWLWLVVACRQEIDIAIQRWRKRQPTVYYTSWRYNVTSKSVANFGPHCFRSNK